MKLNFNSFLPAFFLSGFLFYACSNKTGNPTDEDSSGLAIKNEQLIPADSSFHNGDIIFQSSKSGQSYAIQLATHSIYSHCGLLFNDNGNWFVYEAVQPVTKTPVDEWIARGDNHYYVVERLKNADKILTSEVIQKMRNSINKKLGKDYDMAFGWSDERIYCSELVWKAYNDATGLKIGNLKKLGDFDLSSPIVKKKLKQRYGNKIPLEEPMISPGNIFESDLLIKVRG